MIFEDAALWWALGFGCGLIVMAVLVAWEKWSRDEFSHVPKDVDEGYDDDFYPDRYRITDIPKADDVEPWSPANSEYVDPIRIEPKSAPKKAIRKAKPRTKKAR